MTACPIVQPWVGRPCGDPAEANGRCKRHARFDRCTGCGQPATQECSFAGSIAVCGAPVCDTCEHRDSYARHYPRNPPTGPLELAPIAARRAMVCDCPCHEARRARGCGCCARAR